MTLQTLVDSIVLDTTKFQSLFKENKNNNTIKGDNVDFLHYALQDLLDTFDKMNCYADIYDNDTLQEPNKKILLDKIANDWDDYRRISRAIKKN